MESLAGWGRYPRVPCRTVDARGGGEARAALAELPTVIGRGAGRAYGDAALNRDGVIRLGKSNRLLSFDPATGELAAEGGVLLADVVRTFAPRGWFPPVTPGTKFVTLGGMAACDVHGKNHHGAGSFGDHLLWLDVLLADGSVQRALPGDDLFAATVGGMGLCGIVLRLAFRLIPIQSAKVRQETIAAPNLAAAMEAFEANRASTYSVAWIDCLATGSAQGRSLVHLGEHATAEEAQGAPPHAPKRDRRVPIDFPSFALNPLSVRAFNELYWARGRPGRSLPDYEPYFYPLDSVLEWNRIYGPQGFVQHQCVLPPDGAREALGAMLTRIAARSAGSFLAVLKLMGEGAADRPLSFPMAGWTPGARLQGGRGQLQPADRAGRHRRRPRRAAVPRQGRAGGRIVASRLPAAGALPRAPRPVRTPGRRFRSLLSERLGL